MCCLLMTETLEISSLSSIFLPFPTFLFPFSRSFFPIKHAMAMVSFGRYHLRSGVWRLGVCFILFIFFFSDSLCSKWRLCFINPDLVGCAELVLLYLLYPLGFYLVCMRCQCHSLWLFFCSFQVFKPCLVWFCLAGLSVILIFFCLL